MLQSPHKYDTNHNFFIQNSNVHYFISNLYFQTDEGEDDLKKGTQLLEIYALEIQMYTAQKNNKKLKTLYEQSLHIKSAIPHPLIMGVIRGTNTFIHYTYTSIVCSREINIQSDTGT